MMTIYLAFEDDCAEAILRKLFKIYNSHYDIQILNSKQGGAGTLRKNMPKYNNLAKKFPVIILTDLDNANCVVEFKNNWLKGIKVEQNLHLRIAIRESESWLLADKFNLAKWLEISENLILDNPEILPDPKQHFLTIIKKSKNRDLKEDLLPAKNNKSLVGLAYNYQVTKFVEQHWNPDKAMQNSDSLKRLVKVIQSL